MSSYNRITLMGNLTRDPELRKTKNGASVTDLGLAMNRHWTTEQGEKKEDVTFVDVVVWGRVAENCARYLKKGRPLLVEGRLQMDQWQDKDTGENRSRLRVVGEQVQFLGSAREERDDRSEGRGHSGGNRGREAA